MAQVSDAPSTVITGAPKDPVDAFRDAPAPRWERVGSYGDISYEVAEGIAKVTICRPERRNAFRPRTLFELADAFNRARDDTSVGVIVLTGEGPDAFCSGGDQTVRGDDGYLGDDAVAAQGVGRLNVLDLQVQIRRLPKPVVAMVAGYAIGGGHVLHLVCDLTIAADNARFGQTGPRVGSFDAGYGSSLLARTIGLKRAKEVWMLCRQYDAATALEWGLVNTVVPLGRARARDRRVVPPDAHALADRAADVQGGVQRGRRRARGAPAARGRRDHALLHVRGGPRGSQRLRGAPRAGVREVPEAPVTATTVGRTARWVAGARPRTLPASIVPVVVGAAAARPAPTLWGRLALCAVVALALQVGTNYANDYADGVRGTDARRVGPLRLVASGLASPSSVRAAALVAYGVAAVAGLGLAALVSWWLLAVGVAALAAGWGYTGGPRPYGYLGLGELFVFVFFGLVATAGTTFCLTGRVTALAVVAGASMGLFACALLDANNLRDLAGDALANKRTVAVRLGRRRAGWVYVSLVAAGVAAGAACAASRPAALLIVLSVPLAVRPIGVVLGGAEGPALLPVLARTARVQLVAGLLLAIGLWWSA